MSHIQHRRRIIVPAPQHVMRLGEISIAQALDEIGRRLFPSLWRSCSEPDPAADRFGVTVPTDEASKDAQAAYAAFVSAEHEGGPPGMIRTTREALAASGVDANALAHWEREGVVGRVQWIGDLDHEMSELLADAERVAAVLMPEVEGVVARNYDGNGGHPVPVDVWLRLKPVVTDMLGQSDHPDIKVTGFVVMPRAAFDAAMREHFDAAAAKAGVTVQPPPTEPTAVAEPSRAVSKPVKRGRPAGAYFANLKALLAIPEIRRGLDGKSEREQATLIQDVWKRRALKTELPTTTRLRAAINAALQEIDDLG